MLCKWPSEQSFGKPGFFHPVALPSSLDPLSPFRPVGCWEKDWKVASSGFAGDKSGEYQFCSHFVGWISDNGYKEGWQMWLSCVPRDKKKRNWFLLRTQPTVFITKTLFLWRPQFLDMLSMLSSFSADFGIKLLMLYLIEEYPDVVWNTVTKKQTNNPPQHLLSLAVIYLWKSLSSPSEGVAEKIQK